MKVLRYVMLPALLAWPGAPATAQSAPAPEAVAAVSPTGAVSASSGASATTAGESPAEPAPESEGAPAASANPDETDDAPGEAVPVAAAEIAIPALTPVTVQIEATLGSKLSKTGETFPIRLAAPIVVDGREVVAAGATGMGEVVHAKKSGASGAAGELVLAARYLDLDGRRLKLRSLKLVPMGANGVQTVNAINVASAASGAPLVALVGFLITGGQATVPQGTLAQAKTAEVFNRPASSVAEAPPPMAATADAAPVSSASTGAADNQPPQPAASAAVEPAEAAHVNPHEEGRE